MFLVFEQHSYRTVLLRMKQRRATTALLMDKNTAALLYSTQWLQIAKTHHKIISFDVISRVFPSNFQQIYNYFRFRGMSFYTQNLSNCCKCKYI